MRFNAEFIINHLQRFKPAVKDGKPVMVSYSKVINYGYRVLSRNRSEYTSFKNGAIN